MPAAPDSAEFSVDLVKRHPIDPSLAGTPLHGGHGKLRARLPQCRKRLLHVEAVVAERTAIGLPLEVTTRSFSRASERHTAADWLRNSRTLTKSTVASLISFGDAI